MPANLTPQYLKAEQAYRQATTPDDELRCLQEMLRELPKHKGTDRLQADLKQKISQTKKDCETARSSRKKGPGLRLPHQGAARIVLLGGPNAGKSQFVRATTRAEPAVAEYPFTTREPAPAMMPFEDIAFQLIDTPPVTSDVFDSDTQGLIRGADLVLLMVDMASDDGWEQCQQVLARLQQTKTRIGRRSYLDENDIGLSYTMAFLILNKCDVDEAALRWELFQESKIPDLDVFRVSSLTREGIDELQTAIFRQLRIVRVYTKSPQEKAADYAQPFTVRQGDTLGDVAALVHRDFAEKLKFARVWGSQVHDATTVKSDYVVHDKDVVELHI